ncbi:phosphatidate cytidylyltransferase [Oricola sp.]|uniref:phosphatidate cytidylyltransferase n=1 Tax=Oricola sp. TaxID=1979950 RepID=UPI003BA900D2
MNDLQIRAITGIVLAVLVLGATLAGGWMFSVFAAAVAMVVWSEWMDITCPNSDDRLRLLGYVLLGAIFVLSLFSSDEQLVLGGAALLAAAVITVRSISSLRWPSAGLVYAGGTVIALICLRNSPAPWSGLTAILFLYATVWATDIGAYFAGRAIGGPKIARPISPNKTWAGSVGGATSAVVAGIVVFYFAGLQNYGVAAALAATLSVVSQAGDFFESWIKRRHGLKDSSRILPGHGGVMDRVDGLVFAALALWLLGVAWAGIADPASAFFR